MVMHLASDSLYKKICAVCGKEFAALGPNALYCSGACRNKATKLRKVKHAPKNTNMARLQQNKADIYCPVRSRYDYLDNTKFSGGRRAVDAIQQTSTKVKKRGER